MGSIKHVHSNPYLALHNSVGKVLPATVRSFLGPDKVDVLVGDEGLWLTVPIGQYSGELAIGLPVDLQILTVNTRTGHEHAEAELVDSTT